MKITVTWFQIAVDLFVLMKKQNPLYDMTHDSPYVAYLFVWTAVLAYVGRTMLKIGHHLFCLSLIAVDVLVQIEVANFHIEEIIRKWRFFPTVAQD